MEKNSERENLTNSIKTNADSINLSESQNHIEDNKDLTSTYQSMNNENTTTEIIRNDNFNIVDNTHSDRAEKEEEKEEVKEEVKEEEKEEVKEEVKEEKEEKESPLYTTKYNEANPLNFYDIIIDFVSLLEMEKGLKIYQKQGFDISKEIRDVVIIGIIGESKKGKTYILSKISKIDLPYGNSVITKGLSIKFPQLDVNKNFILIDTVGNENPLLQSEIDCRISSILDFEEKNKEIEKYAIDKQSTEFFLQKYIIDTSNIIIATVGFLTNHDERFINRIKFSCKNKIIYVIHNLKNFNTIKNCKNHIQNVIQKSIFFNLNKRYMSGVDDNYNNIYFVEESFKKNNFNYVVHLILAEENTEAGYYYNTSTFRYLQTAIITQIKKNKKFNLFEDFKQSISLFSPQFFKKKIQVDELALIDDDTLKYINTNNNKLNKWVVNEVGLSDFYSEYYQPNFSYEMREKKVNNNKRLELKIIVEIPGMIKGKDDNSNQILRPKVISRIFNHYFEFKGHFTIKSDCDIDDIYDTINYHENKNHEITYFLSIHFELIDYIRDKEIKDNYDSKNGIYTYICYFHRDMEEEENIIV